MVKFLKKFSILWTVLMSSVVVHGQYPGYRGSPYHHAPMAFSPYHLARINHETLPISQAEFAQLVAESMATSRGPHHHHPPNTDQDYEGPDHWSKESAPSASSAPVPRSLHPNAHHHHNHRSPQHDEQMRPDQSLYHQQRMMPHPPMPMSPHNFHLHHQQQRHQLRPHPSFNNQYHPVNDGAESHEADDHRPASHYQPEESRYPHNDDAENVDQYPMRAPVYETTYGPQDADSNDDEQEQSAHTYGGRPTNEDYYNPNVHPNFHQSSIHPHLAPRHPGQFENGPQLPQPVHEYHDERSPPIPQSHQHQIPPPLPSSSSSGHPIGPQPLYQPHDPPSLAYHRDFSKQINPANYPPMSHPMSSSSTGASHPFSHRHYYGPSRHIHSSHSLHRPQMFGDGSSGSSHHPNYYRPSSPSHHSFVRGRIGPRPRPDDMYMAASSSEDSVVTVPATTTTTEITETTTNKNE